MQITGNKYARASEISSFYMCPRLVYLQRRRACDITERAVRAGFFKSLSLFLATVVHAEYPDMALDEAITFASADTLLVYGPSREKAVIDASLEARGMNEHIITGLLQEKARSGDEELLRFLSPASIGVTAYSDKLRISGTVDKLVMERDASVPVIISASEPPAAGIYASDRVRLAAYAMLLDEKLGGPCTRGVVEYVPGWSLRPAEIRYEDKRRVLYARNRILEMDRGRMPDMHRGKWCSRCDHQDACHVKPALLSSLFK